MSKEVKTNEELYKMICEIRDQMPDVIEMKTQLEEFKVSQDAFGKQLDRIEQKVNTFTANQFEITKKLTLIETKFNKVESRLDTLEKAVEEQGQKLDKILKLLNK